MIVDIQRFVAGRRDAWEELSRTLDRMESTSLNTRTLAELMRFDYLYRRVCVDLVRVRADGGARSVEQYLESLVSRAFSIRREGRHRRVRFAPGFWFFVTFPQAVRRHALALAVTVGVVAAGGAFGGIACALDGESREVLLPGFLHLSPSERVEQELEHRGEHMSGHKATFSGWLIAHNIKVSLMTIAFGITAGVGSVILLFTNGVLIGAVAFDYVADGHARFLMGWLLPHGAVEIPALLLAGQAALVLAASLTGIGRQGRTLRQRLRDAGPDITTIIGGLSVMLVWAGVVEAFLSQYHEPVLPLAFKVSFGTAELLAVVLFFVFSGRRMQVRDRGGPA